MLEDGERKINIHGMKEKTVKPWIKFLRLFMEMYLMQVEYLKRRRRKANGNY
ncbi:MAG TPA: hypothetical protein PK566_12265 [Pseudobacteroides sp.]|nr:hypothetical protein [Pseudobacteroides sp.]